MKLIKPTDEQLNEAFAESVCGWVKCYEDVGDERCAWWEDEADYQIERFPNFVSSADAVIPWLDKVLLEDGYWRATSNPAGVSVVIDCEQGPIADTFARAAVLALLKGKGIEVEQKLAGEREEGE